jgi:hypothetical protein
MKDLSSCSVCKLLVMVALQVIGASCCHLFIFIIIFICHCECADPLVFRMSVLLYILLLMRGVRYMCCFSFCTGVGPSLCVCVGTCMVSDIYHTTYHKLTKNRPQVI